MFAIGWFSYYMLWTACTLLLPARWLAAGLAALARAGVAFGSPAAVGPLRHTLHV